MEWTEIVLTEKMNEVLKDCLTMQKNNLGMYARKRIEELEAKVEKLTTGNAPDFDERNKIMRQICQTKQKAGGVIVIGEDAIGLLLSYDKWLQERIGLRGKVLELLPEKMFLSFEITNI